MIRLREAIMSGLRHPLLGPLLLIGFAFVLAFVALHALEHGMAGAVFTCVVAAFVAIPVSILLGIRFGGRAHVLVNGNRASPRPREVHRVGVIAPARLVSIPLRR